MAQNSSKKESNGDTYNHGWRIWHGFRISTRKRHIIIIYSVSQNTESIKQLVINSKTEIFKKYPGKIKESSGDINHIQIVLLNKNKNIN